MSRRQKKNACEFVGGRCRRALSPNISRLSLFLSYRTCAHARKARHARRHERRQPPNSLKAHWLSHRTLSADTKQTAAQASARLEIALRISRRQKRREAKNWEKAGHKSASDYSASSFSFSRLKISRLLAQQRCNSHLRIKKGRILIFCVFAMQMYKRSPSAMHIS